MGKFGESRVKGATSRKQNALLILFSFFPPLVVLKVAPSYQLWIPSSKASKSQLKKIK